MFKVIRRMIDDYKETKNVSVQFIRQRSQLPLPDTTLGRGL